MKKTEKKEEPKIPERRIQIIGAGATGSHVAYLGSQESDILIPEIIIWENDTIEKHNVRVSQYKKGDIGELKLKTLESDLLHKNGFQIVPVPKFWEEGDPLYECDFLVLAVDNIVLRGKIVKHYFEMYPESKTVVIDPRLGSEEIQIISFVKSDLEDYIRDWIFDPADVYKSEEGAACRVLKTPPHLSMRLACEVYDVIHKHCKSGCYIEQLVFNNFG